ncbi:MAG: NB-ARC domain-containing protein, partial [Cyanobacteria bacterium J06598_1]
MSRDALIVGINNYASSSVFDSLKAPANDAEGVAQILNDYGHFDKVQRFPPTRTETIRVCDRTKITSRALKNEIANLLNPVGKQVSEKVLLYFSGHGRQDQIGKTVEGYLAASNCNPDNDTIGVSLSWLKEQLEQCQARQQVVILDCCYGGDLLNFSQLNADKDGTGRLFIAACRDTEVAYSIGKESVFTRALIKTLNPEHRKKREITDADIKSFLTEQLKGEIQIPLFHNTGTTIRLTSTSKAFSDPTDTNDAANRRFATVPLQMPPLPDHFVERPEQQNAVKAELLNGKAKEGTLVVSAIYGLGGIGKSVLASKLAHDKEIQSRFDDGILWATLGQNPDILPLLSGWIQALGDYDYKPTAIESATNHLRTLLFDKQMLLVVDDVWDPEHLGPFRVGGEGSCVMVTTREARIPEARRYDLDVMDAQQALALMTQKLSEPLSKQARERAETFAARVGYLPLALELAASQIEEGVSWQELFEDFTAEVVRLEGLDTYDAEEMPDDAKRRKYSLLACFNLSLKQLSAEQLQQFAWLGVVPEDVSLTQEMAQTLWQVTSRQAGSILRTFRAKALVLQGAKQADERASYRMHDLMHDLAQRLLVSPVEPEKAGELAGLGLSKAAAHGELLSRYREKAAGEGWHTLKDDGYIFAHLTWHMEQAGQADEIRELLCASDETGRNGWYEACDALGKPAGFVNDLGRAWQLAVDGYEEAPGETVSQLFRYALIRTSLNSLASNVTADMVGGLVKAGVWQPAQGLAYAQQAKDPWRRAACISAVVPYMPKSLLPEVTKTISQIKDAAYRSYVLSKLAERFDEVWPDVLATIRQINDRYGSHRSQTPGFSYRGLALCRIINQLPQQYLEEALEITRQIQEAADRAMSLIDLAKRTTKLWPEALNITRDITDESSRSIALSAMAQHLPELWPEALNLTRDITDEFYRSRALSAMAQHLPEL